ncbi:MAG: thymidine phosphorylase [Candidatus Eisenbacteria bacterium]|uniref:Thymidine phosphorylase n=1 Tax=Eiseniibacteriota bacterium TaxID=2212470 RepID=A0A937XAA7_UNCEI|nr:thymidine phosphorylase [Candidatus Eisenbacteria bacterium]
MEVLAVARGGRARRWPPGALLPGTRRQARGGVLDPRALIARKRDGGALAAAEIAALVGGLAAGEVEEHQISAFMMAVYLRGMTAEETRDLTSAMLASGERLDLSALPGPRIDKHSTGGVGDKISLPLLPLALAAGLRVPMISGRGLGHTGGTLDKLESIPGYRATLPIERLRELVGDPGGFIAGQTAELVPADRIMYALRDVSATVASEPLIVSSILSKKLAAGLTGLVLDVKFGRGAFMADRARAERLARLLVETAGALGLPAVALLTRMDEPIGDTVGNALEARESFAFLDGGRGPEDLRELTLALGGLMVALAGRTPTMAEGARVLERALGDGRAAEFAQRWIAAQGGDPRVVREPRRLRVSGRQRLLRAEAGGRVAEVDALAAGELCVGLGGGRRYAGDAVDPSVGLEFLRRRGDRVAAGDPLVRLYLPEEAPEGQIWPEERELVRIAPEAPAAGPRIVALVHAGGVSDDPWNTRLSAAGRSRPARYPG